MLAFFQTRLIKTISAVYYRVVLYYRFLSIFSWLQKSGGQNRAFEAMKSFYSFLVDAVSISHVMRKPTFLFPTWSDTNQAVQLQKMARGLKFRI